MRIQEKVKTVGFDWEKKEQVLDKIYEELKAVSYTHLTMPTTPYV